MEAKHNTVKATSIPTLIWKDKTALESQDLSGTHLARHELKALLLLLSL